ncbi:MAG: protein YgfX [Pseudomonadota bacterium]
MLRLSLKSSRQLAAGLALGHLAAVGCVAIVPLPLWLKILLSVILVSNLIQSLTREAWRVWPSSIVELQCEREGGVLVKMRSGKEFEACVLGSSFVASYLTIVLLKPNASRRACAVLILPDAAEPELFRQLRVWLKWRVGRGVEPEASAGWAGRV